MPWRKRFLVLCSWDRRSFGLQMIWLSKWCCCWLWRIHFDQYPSMNCDRPMRLCLYYACCRVGFVGVYVLSLCWGQAVMLSIAVPPDSVCTLYCDTHCLRLVSSSCHTVGEFDLCIGGHVSSSHFDYIWGRVCDLPFVLGLSSLALNLLPCHLHS